ncbi:hypothetical protein BH11MYX1_BH11MYX1_08130 [soil metagenome]
MAAEEPKHVVYAEVLGKAGEYGLGYEHAIAPRLSLGVAGSYALIRDQQLVTIAPYLHLTLASRHAHSVFAEVGAAFVHSHVPSPVANWDGMTDDGGGGFISLGYQHTTQRFVVRATTSAMVGEGGVGPAIGFTVGVLP